MEVGPDQPRAQGRRGQRSSASVGVRSQQAPPTARGPQHILPSSRRPRRAQRPRSRRLDHDQVPGLVGAHLSFSSAAQARPLRWPVRYGFPQCPHEGITRGQATPAIPASTRSTACLRASGPSIGQNAQEAVAQCASCSSSPPIIPRRWGSSAVSGGPGAQGFLLRRFQRRRADE